VIWYVLFAVFDGASYATFKEKEKNARMSYSRYK